MGRDSNFSCATCRKTYYLGYAPYSAWHDTVTSIKEYHETYTLESLNYSFNIYLRKCLEEHDGHKFAIWSSDWYTIKKDGHLYWIAPREPSLEMKDVGKFKRINLYE